MKIALIDKRYGGVYITYRLGACQAAETCAYYNDTWQFGIVTLFIFRLHISNIRSVRRFEPELLSCTSFDDLAAHKAGLEVPV